MNVYGSPSHKPFAVFALKWSHVTSSHSIHGLWFETVHNPHSAPCNDIEEALKLNFSGFNTGVDQAHLSGFVQSGDSVLSAVDKYWRKDWEAMPTRKEDDKFLLHEYNKHGRCLPDDFANLDGTVIADACKFPAYYFAFGISLYAYVHNEVVPLDRTAQGH